MTYQIDTQIPYGNACDTEVRATGDGTLVSFAPDPHGGPETLWFCLRIRRLDGTNTDGLTLVLKHSHNMLGGHHPEAMRPVIRYGDDPWERLPEASQVTSPDGRIELHWTVAAPEQTVDIAYSYPYGLSEVQTLMAETGEVWRRDTIGVSQAARPLWRLSNDYGVPDGERPGLYLMARQHSGETPGSWVLDGFLRYIATLNNRAPLVWAVPLSNIDGIEGGDYGKDNFPYDLNRAWGRPPMRHEVSVFQWDMARWRDRCRPTLGIDFHAPGACESSGVYTHVCDPDGNRAAYDAVMPWIDRIRDALMPEYAADDFVHIPRYASRWETPNFRDYGWSQLGVPMLTFETPYALAKGRVLTQADYREIGRRIATGVLDHMGRGV